MSYLIFAILLFIFSIFAGIVGSLTGLGGGVVIIPILVLVFHVDIHIAMGTSLIAILATSSGASIAYSRQGLTNFRIGIFLETITVIAAFVGASLVAYFPSAFLMILFSCILFLSAYLSFTRQEQNERYTTSHPWAMALKMQGYYQQKPYFVQNVPYALTIMGGAGFLAGLLGIGSGALKVLAMDQALRLPYKISTATSNFMIGITAAASAGVYLFHDYIVPGLVFPVMIGVLIGSYSGSRVLRIVSTNFLRVFFSIIIVLAGIQMLYEAWITMHAY